MTVGLAGVSVDGLVTSSYASLMQAIANGADEDELTAAYYAADVEAQMDRALIHSGRCRRIERVR